MVSMLSVFSAIPFVMAVGWIAARRRFLLYFLLFVLILFVWRLIAAIYIDVAGPVYANQLYRTIGGGTSSFVLVATQIVTLLGMVLVFSGDRLRRLAAMRVEKGETLLSLSNRTLVTAIFGGVLLFMILLYVNMARIGVIPLVAGVEEFLFTQCAGRLNGLLVRFGDRLLFFLGLFLFNPLLLGKKPDGRFLWLFVGLSVYMLLAGHRFSAFYRFATFFVMPLGIIMFWKQFSQAPQADQTGIRWAQARSYLPDLAIIAAVTVALIAIGTYRSLYFPIGATCESVAPVAATPVEPKPRTEPISPAGPPPAAKTPVAKTPLAKPVIQVVSSSSQRGGVSGYLRQRLLVIQGDLWWLTYERIFLKGEFDPARTFTRIFVDPVLPILERNSTIPYLMERAIGERAYPILSEGSQYTGGFPEIFFELFGKVLAFPMIALSAIILGWFTYKLVEAVLLQRAVRTFLVFYASYSLILLPATGMLNFLVNWKFWFKVAVLVGWLIFEHVRDGRATPRLPPPLAREPGPAL